MDPWHWSVDDVVKNLCSSRDVWKDRPSSRLPDPVELETALRENDVDGPTLLQHIDHETLKGDLGIKSLGSRSAILFAIESFRSLSHHWVVHQGKAEALKYKVNKESKIHSSEVLPESDTTFIPRNSPIPFTNQTIEQTNPGASSTNVDVRSPTARPGEYIVTQGGAKRRRLQLTSENNENNAEDAGSEKTASALPLLEPAHNYLRRIPIPLDEIFYSGVRNGQSVLSIDDSSDAASGFSFIVNRKSQLSGDQHYVSRRLKHFLYSGPENLDNERIVRYPYPGRLLVSPETRQSATLFVSSMSEVLATKRDASLLAHGSSETFNENEETNIDHSWDYLLSKYPCNDINDDILPVYAESGSENGYESSLLDEIDLEQREMEHSRNRIADSKDPPVVVDEEMEKIRTHWRDEKFQHRQRTAWKIWKKAQGRNRSALITETEAELERLGVRLQKLKTELCSHPWENMKSLRKQCQCLSATAEDQEDLKWKLGLWAEANPPPRTFVTRTKSRKVKKEPSEDGESCESSQNISDGLEDFIDVDEIENIPDDGASRAIGPPLRSLGPSHAATPEISTPNSIASGHTPVELAIGPTDTDVTENESHEESAKLRENGKRSQSEDSVLGRQEFGLANNSLTTGFAPGEVVDLTMSSPPPYADADDLFTESEDDRVENCTSQEIEAWNWRDLDEQSDRKRIVLKLMRSLDLSLVEKLRRNFIEYSQEKLQVKIQDALTSLLHTEDGDAELDSSKENVVSTICKLYICWHDGRHRHFANIITAPIITAAIESEDFGSFYTFMKCLSHSNNPVAAEENSADHTDESQEVTGDSVDPSPRKQRQRAVQQSKRGLTLREDAQERRARGQLRALQLTSSLASTDQAAGKQSVIVNVGKEEYEDPIFLNNHIATRIKPHQIDGLRFLWREIVSVGQSGECEMQGCLLAHIMGLGKTMQTISLLVTIAEAATSSNPNIRDQIPQSLRESKTLVICPAGLIENWKDEFRVWVPPEVSGRLGGMFGNPSEKDDRPRTISQWHEHGGILILGYEMFLNLCDNLPPLERDMLLHGPNIVIADEAHRLKTPGSQISTAANKLKTPSRIALTGSPLSNNLEDYFHMINWVAPGYLGDLVEFRAHYKEPIEAGTYSDSTKAEQRKSLKRLSALGHDIEPKVNRADISAIQNEMKSKIEFVITVPLTEWQAAAYRDFVWSVLNHQEEAYVSVKVFDWIHFLALLCIHPSMFRNGLRNRAQKSTKGRTDPSDSESFLAASEPDGEPGKAHKSGNRNLNTENGAAVKDVASPEPEQFASMVTRQTKILEQQGIDDEFDISLSHKTALIAKIVLLSKQLGDKVLIFSQRLETFAYLETHLLKNLPIKVKMSKINGQTPAAMRLTMVKDFNSGEADVFLISTKAGGLGLNISGANRVILVDFSFNPMHEEQAIARAYRIGQQKEVFVYHLITGGTYEGKLHNSTIFKKQLAARVVDKKNPTRSASKSNFFLFQPEEVPKEELCLDELKGKDKIMDEILTSNARGFIRAVRTTDTMHAEIDEKLTAEEETEVQEMIADDQLRRKDRAAWQRKQTERQQAYLDNPATPQAPSLYPASQPSNVPYPLSQPSAFSHSVKQQALHRPVNTAYLPSTWQHTHQSAHPPGRVAYLPSMSQHAHQPTHPPNGTAYLPSTWQHTHQPPYQTPPE